MRVAAGGIHIGWILAVGCSGVADPAPPPNARVLVPPAAYSLWWEMTTSCSGRAGSMQSVDWYEASSLEELGDQGESTLAYWSGAGNRIVLLSSVVRSPRVVRHEMLHALIAATGHPREQFMERCGGVVVCTGECSEEAGPAPSIPADIPRVQPSAMLVTTTVNPVEPNAALYDGYFSVTVRVQNPANHPVVVELPLDSDNLPRTFGYVIGDPDREAATVHARDNSVTRFAPGESKLHMFDFLVAPDFIAVGKVRAGFHVITGSFGGQTSPPVTFRVR